MALGTHAHTHTHIEMCEIICSPFYKLAVETRADCWTKSFSKSAQTIHLYSIEIILQFVETKQIRRCEKSIQCAICMEELRTVNDVHLKWTICLSYEMRINKSFIELYELCWEKKIHYKITVGGRAGRNNRSAH